MTLLSLLVYLYKFMIVDSVPWFIGGTCCNLSAFLHFFYRISPSRFIYGLSVTSTHQIHNLLLG